jgi:hypothetical protein
LMPTFVSQDPQTSSEKALDEAVECPKRIPNELVGDCFWGDIVVEDIEGYGKAEHVSEDIAKPPKTGPLEAVGWDGISNVLDGEVWQFEFVSITVDERSALGFFFASREGG